jgi:hypothetical protein
MTRFYTLYTKDTPYEAEALETVAAFAQFGIACIALPYFNHGDWMKNAMARSELLVSVAAQTPNDTICMVDADNRPKADPILLRDFSADFGCEDRGEKTPSNRRYSAGVILFGATKYGRQALSQWQLRCKLDQSPGTALREQFYLYQTIQTLKENKDFKFLNVGNAYNRKPEDVKPGDDTVMVHYVASRRFLKKIGGKR